MYFLSREEVSYYLWEHVSEKLKDYHVSYDINKLKRAMIFYGVSLLNIPEEFAIKYPNDFYDYACLRISRNPKEIMFISDKFIKANAKKFEHLAEIACLEDYQYLYTINEKVQDIYDRTQNKRLLELNFNLNQKIKGLNKDIISREK